MDARTDSPSPIRAADSAPAQVQDVPPSAAAPPPKPKSNRRLLFIILGVVVLIGVIIWGLNWVFVGSHHVSTDDAYVNADVADVTPLVAGPVIQAPISDTLPVKKGDVLVVIDPTDFKLALAADEAALGQAERKVQGYFANSDAQTAMINAKGADIVHARALVASAEADLAKAHTDLARRQALAHDGAVSGDELTTAENRVRETEADLSGAQASLAEAQANQVAAAGQARIAQALVAGTGVSNNPEVAAAQAKVDQAQLDLQRTVIRAPIDGIIAKNTVEIGQRVETGAQLMTVVPIQDAYVDANFKEEQLRHMHLGQEVTLTSDYYGGGVTFHGRIVGLAGGTGSAFAVIPAQNATGNWIKVVQRLPVRVELDPKELKAHPLRVGLSMDVDIDTAQSAQK
ncbi:MAG TPA: HlyD family efflux transporter periplasmic adaptor subunit [Caulobacteraceae bacterium]|nr:HlyD family efflux transporter periplasmic adaptor subunit [Caulobacteraceae bacterium]